MTTTYRSHSPEETARIASEFASTLQGGERIELIGELGAGKTAFVKGLASALGIEGDRVLSPTFVLCRTYEGRFTLHHCDLYRVENEEEAYAAGIAELLNDSAAIVAVEWADCVRTLMPGCIEVRIERMGDHERAITIGRKDRQEERA